MGFKKFGEGQVRSTEGMDKTAAKQEWTAEDAAALDRENVQADTTHEEQD
jgi:hypothetical protein